MRSAGYSLIELLVAVTALAILLGVAARPVGHWRDAWAVRAARDDLAAALAWTRLAAASHGGAALVIPAGSARFSIITPAGPAGPGGDLEERYGVRPDSADADIEIRYDRLGVGRLANRTLVLRRGAARAGLVISAYGRVRRW